MAPAAATVAIVGVAAIPATPPADTAPDPPSALRTKSQLFTFPRGSGMNGAESSCLQAPSTMNLYWW
jgi:hypothetical protein